MFPNAEDVTLRESQREALYPVWRYQHQRFSGYSLTALQ